MREKRSKRRRAGRREEASSTMLSTSAEDFAVDSGISPKAGTSKLQSQGAPADASPDSKCPICLDRFDNVSHLDRCLHRFCFRCIQEWAKNKAECPLCKQPFNSIFHSVRAEDDFKEYVLRPTLNGSFGSPDGHRFRYRTTMTRDNYLSLRSLRSSSRRTFSPPDNGVLFEGISNVSSHQRGSDINQMMRRLASRRQASAEGRTMRQIQEQELINFRRALYRAGLRVRNIQDGGRYRDISAEFFRRNPACLHRLVPWLKRELTVLFGSHGSLVNIVQHIIMRNVTLYDMESQAFAEDLQPFLLHRTDHFIHEFINFARCPYNIEAYDHHANYDCPAPSYEEGSRSESSVITISPDEVNTREPDVPSSSLDVGQAPWDDETPGPSYTAVDRTASWTANLSDEQPSSSRQTASDAKSATEDVPDKTVCSDDCVIVGFVKPLAERTPELVELSSDSEGSLCEVKIEEAKKPQIKPFTLIDSSGSSRSSSPLSSHSSNKDTWKFSRKPNIAKEKSHSKKKKEHKPKEASSRNVHSSRKDKGRSCNSDSSRRRARSQSSDCYSRSSQNRSYESHNRKHRKNSPRNKKSPDKRRHRSWREKRRSRSRDRSSSWRSQTVSLTSESSRERGGSRSTSRNLSRGRSRSRDSDNDYIADNYRSTYQWEYTYYSRNRDRDGYEQSFRKHARGKGHYARPSPSPEYRIQSYSTRRDLKRKKGSTSAKPHHRDRYRSRSRSCSRTNTSGASLQPDKPSGKRKYKTRHLERQEEKDRNREMEAMQGNAGHYKDDLTETSSNEPKRRKKTRSPSVEIVYEGKALEGSRCHKKKKKKKHKKKHRREQSANSSATSPIIITIDSDSDLPAVAETSSNGTNTALSEKHHDQDSVQSAPSQSPSTSTTANITEPVSEEPAGPSSKDYDLFSSNGHLDAATGILDGLHFDDSSNEPTLPTTSSPAKIEPAHCEEVAMAELHLPDSKPEQDAMSPAPTFLMDSQENLIDNSQELFADTISDLLESMAAPTVL
ncbi:E3 ubiquitin-protein ligase Topors [Leptodactylus fuscus]|uniref:E3 ubiquitin-protein ligase Topors n=1 Tax=Leptodactylus fuscus TaxID=238119 RepID=UPI003F4F3632